MSLAVKTLSSEVLGLLVEALTLPTPSSVIEAFDHAVVDRTDEAHREQNEALGRNLEICCWERLHLGIDRWGCSVSTASCRRHISRHHCEVALDAFGGSTRPAQS